MKKDINQLFVYPKTWVSRETGEIAKSVRQWANKEIVSRRLEYQDDYDNLFPRVRGLLALDIGCQGLMFSAEEGGLGFNRVDAATLLAVILKEIGRADASIGFIHAVEYAGSAVLAGEDSGGTGLAGRLAPFFCGDALNTMAPVLPAGGRVGRDYPLFEGRPLRATLANAGDGYVISGKSLRPLDLGADAAVLAVVCADPGNNPALALIPADADGVVRGESFRKTGLEGCRNADLDLDRVALAADQVLSGEAPVRSFYAWLNLLLGAVSTGAAMGCLEVVGEWSEERVIKAGGLIKDNSLCAAVLAEAYEEVAIAWTMIHHLAYALANPGEWGAAGSSQMFAFSQMSGRRVQAGVLLAVNKMMELMASEGYAREGRVEKSWRDIKTIQSALCGIGGEAPVRLDVARYVFDSRVV